MDTVKVLVALLELLVDIKNSQWIYKYNLTIRSGYAKRSFKNLLEVSMIVAIISTDILSISVDKQKLLVDILEFRFSNILSGYTKFFMDILKLLVVASKFSLHILEFLVNIKKNIKVLSR